MLGQCREGEIGMKTADYLALAAKHGVEMNKRRPYLWLVPMDCSVADCRYTLLIGQFLSKERRYGYASDHTWEMYRIIEFDPIGEVILTTRESAEGMSHKCHRRRPLFGIDLHRRKRNIAF